VCALELSGEGSNPKAATFQFITFGGSMTRKHFKRAAEIISKIEDPQVRRATALSFAVWFREENPRFKTQLFIDACGS
jgi:hypothetical protein